MNNSTESVASLVGFIWKNANDLWGPSKHIDFGRIILPFTLLRRLECVLEPTREAMEMLIAASGISDIELDIVLHSTSGYPFYNTYKYSLATLSSTKTRCNLEEYLSLFFG